MNSRIFFGTLRHDRSHEVEHGFSYPLHLYAVDLDELPALDRSSVWFGHNRLRPVALHDRDYLYPGREPLVGKVQKALLGNGITASPAQVILVTALRQFNYVFNPASFFFCRDAEGRLFAVLLQVNNTFGETHLYVLDTSGDGHSARDVKVFHVSPFFPREGEYEFDFALSEDSLAITIIYRIAGQAALVASFKGSARPMAGDEIARTVLGHPLRAAMTYPRILWQAARLYFGKKLKVFSKPEPCSPLTIREAPPPVLETLGRRMVTSFLGKLDHGGLLVQLPKGETLRFGPGGADQAAMTVHRPRFFRRVLLAADIGFAEAYIDKDWDSPDLAGLLSLIGQREEVLDDRRLWPALAGRALNWLSHLRRDNTPKGSRRNIREHYDLGNDFYRLFLDPTMCYSSGIFEHAESSLEQSQLLKIATIIERAQIGPEDHVLEIGCGWGGFAIEAVRRTGCRLVGITISREQYEWATRRVREEGLEDRIEIRLSDYRHVEGRFSRIVSIEMLEAVGHRHMPAYFRVLDRLLAPHGRAVLQVITMPDQKYLAYRLGSDFIRKHVFPGGHVPSLRAVARAMASRTRLEIAEAVDIGRHYVRTLAIWRENLLAAREEVAALGFDESFLRKWDYYFCYCEAGFRTRLIRNYQLVLDRMGESSGVLR